MGSVKQLLSPQGSRIGGVTPDHSPVRQKAKESAKKRVTTAALSEQLTGLMELLSTMTEQISELQRGHEALQDSI